MRHTLNIMQCHDQSMRFRQFLHGCVQFFLQFSQVDLPPGSFFRNQSYEIRVVPATDRLVLYAGDGSPLANVPGRVVADLQPGDYDLRLLHLWPSSSGTYGVAFRFQKFSAEGSWWSYAAADGGCATGFQIGGEGSLILTAP